VVQLHIHGGDHLQDLVQPHRVILLVHALHDPGSILVHFPCRLLRFLQGVRGCKVKLLLQLLQVTLVFAVLYLDISFELVFGSLELVDETRVEFPVARLLVLDVIVRDSIAAHALDLEET